MSQSLLVALHTRFIQFRMKLTLLSTFFIVFGSLQAGAQSAPDTCGKIALESMGDLKYCLKKGVSSRTLLFFHGVNNDESSFNGSVGRKLMQSFERMGLNRPSVLTVSLGRIFWLNGEVSAKSRKTDIQEITEGTVKLVRRLGLENDEGLDILGDSMGGHNSIQIFTRSPEYFRKIVLICPAITKVSPFASNAEWDANRKDEGADWGHSTALRQVLRHYYGSVDRWQAESPLLYVGSEKYVPFPYPQDIHIATVEGDDFGFEKVQLRLADALRAKGHLISTHKSKARHCDITTDAVADFLGR